jgi:hypothetical protein
MIHTNIFSLLVITTLTLGSGIARSDTAPDPAEILGGDVLTPIGAERAGNSDGSIPPWTGGITQPPATYNPGKPFTDPYPNDSVILKITASNMEQHADKLSAGQQALLLQYPDSWYINVYPSRRSASYPEFVYQSLQANSKQAKLLTEGLGGVVGATVSSPFPQPREGVELVWNHTMRWRGIGVSRVSGQAAVTRALGNYRVFLFQEEYAAPYARPEPSETKSKYPGVSFGFKQKVLAPGAEAGLGSLLLETYDHTHWQRQNWTYNPGLRRIVRAPFSGFDNPAPYSDGLRFQDEFDLFNGSPALYDWKLLGKRELYIPYNSYRLHTEDPSYENILHLDHINPELLRYELHRVWVVEGTVRSATRNSRTMDPNKRGHVFAKRVFYIDEDSWQIAVADSYDKDGNLWRMAEGHMINFYNVPTPWYSMEVFYDFKVRRYLAKGLDSRFGLTNFSDDFNPNNFSPLALEYFVR